MATEPTIISEQHGSVAVLRFNRPQMRNAINEEFVNELKRLAEGIDVDVRAVVLCGAGDHFCAGLDLMEHEDRPPFEVLKHSRLVHRALDALQFGGRPVIAALHGGVIGGGLEIAVSAHIRVADTTTFYRLPEGKRGIFVGGGGSVRVSRVIGVTRMIEMMLTGRTLDADEGQRLCLSHYLTEKGGALAKAMELAEVVGSNALISNYMILEGLTRIADMPPAEGLFTEAIAVALAQTSDDARAGIRAFLEKREARFHERG